MPSDHCSVKKEIPRIGVKSYTKGDETVVYHSLSDVIKWREHCDDQEERQVLEEDPCAGMHDCNLSPGGC